jgi:hypothetical protein
LDPQIGGGSRLLQHNIVLRVKIFKGTWKHCFRGWYIGDTAARKPKYSNWLAKAWARLVTSLWYFLFFSSFENKNQQSIFRESMRQIISIAMLLVKWQRATQSCGDHGFFTHSGSSSEFWQHSFMSEMAWLLRLVTDLFGSFL